MAKRCVANGKTMDEILAQCSKTVKDILGEDSEVLKERREHANVAATKNARRG